MFKVGDIVECVAGTREPSGVIAGEQYKIIYAGDDPYDLVRVVDASGVARGYKPHRFKLAQPKKETKMCNCDEKRQSTKITLENESGVYVVESFETEMVFDDLMELVVKPVLLACGYHSDTVKKYFGEG